MAEWKYQKAIHIPDPSLPTFCWLNSSGIQGAFSWVIESINFSLLGTEHSREGGNGSEVGAKQPAQPQLLLLLPVTGDASRHIQPIQAESMPSIPCYADFQKVTVEGESEENAFISSSLAPFFSSNPPEMP